MSFYPGRAGLLQRVLPAYRGPFADALARRCRDGLGVFAGEPGAEEAIHSQAELTTTQNFLARNIHLGRISSPGYLLWQAGLVRWLTQWDPQALIVEANPRYLSTPLAVRWMHARGRPVVGWGLGAPPLQGRLSPVRQKGRRNFLNSFDAWVAYSQRGADEYRSQGLPAERIFIAPNAATPPPAGPPPRRPLEIPGKPMLLFVGRLQARKRVDLLLRACAALPAALQPRLVVVGDGPARTEFETLAAQVYPTAEFLGARHGAKLDPLFAAADLFVLPGSGGLAVQEAMAHGLPVIVAEADGTQADLVRPSNGWMTPPGDLDGLIDRLHAALSDTAGLRRMGAESYRIVSEEVNVERMAEVFVRAMIAAGEARQR